MTIYYVDAASGSDNNSGLSAARAWKSVAEVNAHHFHPGDQILFRAGSVFHESLVVTDSGTAAAPLTFGTYGSGPAPVFCGSIDLSDAAWRQAGAGSNAWTTSYTGRIPDAVYRNDVPLGREVAAPGQINQQGEWCLAAGKLTIWSAGNPAKGSVKAEIDSRMLKLQGVHDVVVAGLHFTQGGAGVIVNACSAVRLVGVEADDNYGNGLEIADSTGVTVLGGSYHDNGRVTAWYNSGHGIVFRLGAAGNVVEGVQAYGNAEDGVQFGFDAGSGNVVRDSELHDNHEDGIDLKHGSQTLTANRIYDNDQQGINAHDGAADTYVSDNFIASGRWALNVSGKASVISSDNVYCSWGKGPLNFVDLAGHASSFTNDALLVKGSAPYVRGGATLPHSFVDVIKDTTDGLAAKGPLFGSHGNDAIGGGNGNEVAYGFGGDDTLLGGGGHDDLSGGGGHDSINGGAGSDTISGGTGNDTLLGGTGADSITAGAGADLVDGGRSNDTVGGAGGDDTLGGGAGNDMLDGGAGADRLDGGIGRDTLAGGAGFDTFVFQKGDLRGDVIVDFDGNGSAAGDVLRFLDYGDAAHLSHLTGSTWAVVDGAVIETFTIQGVSSLAANDFAFV